jgi:putative DNA primase/helicase
MNGGRGYALVVVADGAVSATPTGSQPEHPLKKSLAPLASNVIRELLGDYAKTADPTLLLSKKSDGIPNNVARLAGARFVSTSETESGRRLDETQVKQLTGGDRIAARFLYAEFFEFAALFKLFLATNHRPKIRGTDNGIWRRIRLVPFNVTIPDEQQDKELKDKLRNELPGILAWAVRGSLAWQKQGLGIPPEVREATESYRCDMDVVGTFISERCIQKAGIKTPVSKLYGEYVAWCEENGEEPLKKGDFGHHMSAHGFSDDRDGRTRYRVGIGLVTDVTDYDAHFSDSSEFEQSVPNLSKQSSQASPSSQPMEAEVEVEL